MYHMQYEVRGGSKKSLRTGIFGVCAGWQYQGGALAVPGRKVCFLVLRVSVVTVVNQAHDALPNKDLVLCYATHAWTPSRSWTLRPTAKG